MRMIEAFDKPIRTVAVSPDGRFLAAATGYELGVFSWVTGEKLLSRVQIHNRSQFGFGLKTVEEVMVYVDHRLRLSWISPSVAPAAAVEVKPASKWLFSGGIAVSPDGKTLVATSLGRQQEANLERWSIPAWRPLIGFNYWSPFQKLAFSPNGEFIAGINNESFELRIAVTGGLNGRQRPRDTTGSAFLTFPRHGETVVFGWGEEFYVMETRAGNLLNRVPSPGKPFVDAAFTGNGRHLATVDRTDVMRLWSGDSWQVTREYDWKAGGLTCITAGADGLTGVCGTSNGHLIAFDVDE